MRRRSNRCQFVSEPRVSRKKPGVTVHTKVSANRSDKSSREEVEAAFRTIISWSGDDLDHCKYHIAPIIRQAWVAYVPKGRAVGISKLARVVDIYARRLQTQESMTAQIAKAIDKALEPKGTAILIEAVHQCMSLRGVNKRNVATITTQFTGEFKSNPVLQARFMELVRAPSSGFSL